MYDTDSVKSKDYGEDFAKPYTALDNHSFHLLPSFDVQAGTIMDSALGMRSTINDMLK